MKKFYLTLVALLAFTGVASAQGWPSNYSGIMLQGFYWDSFDVTNWQSFTDRADELSVFDLIWVPNSATPPGGSDAESMGYMPYLWLRHNSNFGNEATLLNMIDVFRNKGTYFIEDVVINHKSAAITTIKDETSPFYKKYLRFPNENVNGYRLTWDNTGCTGVCSDDDVPGGGNPDTGDGFDGARDLDHTNKLVQQNCKTYQQFLMQSIGYVGFRLDMVKGYAPRYTGMYNAASQPEFSVGEYWDGYDAITGWITNTKAAGQIQSGAFDFPFKYAINEAFAGGNWSKLAEQGVILDPNWRRYMVTFVDNHDTRREDFNTLSANIEDANMLILALPGTPCVLIQDYENYKTNITKMMDIRRTVGITNTSDMEVIKWDNGAGIQFDVTGKNGKLRIDLGDAVNIGAPSGMKLALSTAKSRVYISSNLTTGQSQKETYHYGKPFFSMPSGTYADSVVVKIGPSIRGSQFVYTTDGSTPTPNSNPMTTTTDLTLKKSTTIIAGIVENGAVTKLAKQDYIIAENLPEKITVYVKSPSAPTLYAWDDNGVINGTWPGTKMTTTKVVGGITWYAKEFSKTSPEYAINVIFNNGAAEGAVQTPDITDVSSDIFYTFNPEDGSARDVTALYLNSLYNPTVSIDKASGDYPGPFKANITASNPEATVVYTTDGTTPSATNGTQATGKAEVNIPANSNVTLKAGVLIEGAVENIVSATYVTGNEPPVSGVDIYVDASRAPYLYVWNDGGELNGTWPGTLMSSTTVIIDNVKWYHKHFDTAPINIIFNKGQGGEGNQTGDINGLTEGQHFFTYDGGSGYTDVTGEHTTNNANIPACATWVDNAWFFYFENNGGYVDPYAWVWGDDYAEFNGGTDWPGTELVVQVGMSGNGNPVYRWTYANMDKTPTGLVISDFGSPQTSDFTFVNGGYYTVNGLVGTVSQPAFAKGDLNHDGAINVGDVSELYRLILSGSTAPEADLNGDGQVNTGDVSELYRIMLL